jgi:tetratricopeptide (TPR) repeat protein
MRKLLMGLVFSVFFAMPAAARTATCLVFPLENQTKVQALAWIGDAVAVSLSEQMQTPMVDSISRADRVRVIESSDLPPNAPLSRASMIRVGQRAGADFIVYGSYTGSEGALHISLRVLNTKSLHLSGEKSASGPSSALPALENELAWEILADTRNTGVITRADFRSRMRSVPNPVYESYISALSVADEEDRIEQLLKTIESFHDFPQASFELGSYYYSAGDFTRAVQYLKPALAEGQDLLETQFMLGACYLKMDNPAEAIPVYKAFLARFPAVEVFNNLGVAYLRLADHPLAVQNFIEARKISPADFTVALNLAILRRIEGNEVAALRISEELATTHPEQGMAHYLYYLALAAGGEAEKAGAELQRAEQLGIEPEVIRKQDPHGWARMIPTWTRHEAIRGGN